jgi:hypothetical protein
VTREEKIERAKMLRERGWSYKKIGNELGVGYQTARRWIDHQAAEDDRRRARELKKRYRGTCATCGASTNGSAGPGRASNECSACRHRREHNERRWTPEAIVAAIRLWANRHGQPPSAHPDWTHSGPDHPASSTVLKEMGSWNAAIEAAGFESRSRQVGLDREEVVRLYVDERLGCDTIAELLDVSPRAIQWHVRRAGVMRSQSEANRIAANRRARAAA